MVDDSISRRLFVGHVPAWLLAEKKAQEYFAKYGAVVSLDVNRDLRDLQATGFCYVTFATPDEATFAATQMQQDYEAKESQMVARVAFARGPPHVEVPKNLTDKLVHASQKHPSQSQQIADEDDEDLLFFSQLSQRSSQHSRRPSSHH
ncbi:hypothetical protein H310_00334 [Aphanomyces invadans]|uniref:RRM domain-containing protein n=1 Tax=Aphanomyces invadans TaxID=157072 RepID=A0A024UTS9_9STRA|nr:hypothetical protein H310_00334 [Aphanomyces invadans]ETW09891.1 hypothetical protein H310_00334 [Aphanomyces invadans]|eukprot:XP_008861302.1 hypothetical protein H310_00334 [Aphanomyces invadans]